MQEGGPFEVAKRKCEARSSTLAHHIAPVTQDFLASELERIKDQMTQKLLWIGLQKDATVISRTWRWLDGGLGAVVGIDIRINFVSVQNT